MDEKQMAACFNEWMRSYIEDPTKSESEFCHVKKFIKDQADGVEPSYGAQCVADMKKHAAALAA